MAAVDSWHRRVVEAAGFAAAAAVVGDGDGVDEEDDYAGGVAGIVGSEAFRA